jgi:RimJ/RimL family protein N-acetyltransferase
MEDSCRFFHMLGVRAIERWPPEELVEVLPLFREQLERHPDLAGWLSWYWVLRPEDAPDLSGPDRAPSPPVPAILIGSGGFKGPPESGRVEIGYHVREAHRRRGYATEALGALLAWAFAHPEVRDVRAETEADNAASIGLLEKLGFACVGDGSRPGLLCFAARGSRGDSSVASITMPLRKHHTGTNTSS